MRVNKVHCVMRIKAFVMLLLVISCTNDPELKDDDQNARDALIGVWRGAGDYQDEVDRGWREYWRMSRNQDGSYSVQYLLVHDEDKHFEHSMDSGKWGYENGKYFEVNQHKQKSVFKVISLKKDNFQYNYIQRGDDLAINETKTSDAYQLQDPPEGYTEFVYQEAE